MLLLWQLNLNSAVTGALLDTLAQPTLTEDGHASIPGALLSEIAVDTAIAGEVVVSGVLDTTIAEPTTDMAGNIVPGVEGVLDLEIAEPTTDMVGTVQWLILGTLSDVIAQPEDSAAGHLSIEGTESTSIAIDFSAAGDVIYNVNVTDHVNVTDNVVVADALAVSIADTAGAADAAATKLYASFGRVVADAVVVADATLRGLRADRSAADAMAAVDAASAQLKATFSRLVADAALVSDTSARSLAASRIASDAAASTDAVSKRSVSARSAQDAASVIDAALPSLFSFFARTVQDVIAASDSASRGLVAQRGGTDSAAVGEHVAVAAVVCRSPADSVASTDAVTRSATFGRTPTDTATTTDAEGTYSEFDVVVKDDLGGGIVYIVYQSVADPIVMTDDVVVQLQAGRAAADSVAATDDLSKVLHASRLLSDAVAGSDASARSLEVVRTDADAISALDTAVRALEKYRSSNDVCSTTDVVRTALDAYRRSADGISALDFAARSLSVTRELADTESVGDASGRTATFGRTGSDTVAAWDSMAVASDLSVVVSDKIDEGTLYIVYPLVADPGVATDDVGVQLQHTQPVWIPRFTQAAVRSGGGGGGGGAWCIEFPGERFPECTQPVVTLPLFVLPSFDQAFRACVVRPIERGIDGAVESAKAVAAAAWQARLSEAVRDWVVGVVRQARATDSLGRLDAILAAVREQMTYLPDPAGVERVTHPANIAERLLNGEAVSGDCSDHAGLIAAAAANIGMRASLVVQWNKGEQPHLIAAVHTDGRWVPLDGATAGLSAGQKLASEHEVWVPLPGTMADADTVHVDEQEEEPVFLGVAGADTWAAPTVRAVAPPLAPLALPRWLVVGVAFAAGIAFAAFIGWMLWKEHKKQLKAAPVTR